MWEESVESAAGHLHHSSQIMSMEGIQDSGFGGWLDQLLSFWYVVGWKCGGERRLLGRAAGSCGRMGRVSGGRCLWVRLQALGWWGRAFNRGLQRLQPLYGTGLEPAS